MPWETETGLKDDFHMRVDSAYFEEWEKGNNVMTLVLVGADYDDPEGDLITLRYGTGPGWESADGSEVVHDKGKERFNKNTKMGKLVDRIVEVLPENQLKKLGEPTEAATFMNMVMHFVAEYEDYKMKDRDTGKMVEGTSRVVLPTEIWLDEESFQKSGSKVDSKPQTSQNKGSGTSSKAEEARKKLAAKKAAESKSSSDESSNGEVDELTKSLIKLAKSNDHSTFAEKALDMDEVASDDDLVSSVMDDSEDGFWAKHHA